MEYTLVLVWLAVLAVLTAAATPLAAFLLSPLPDRGSGLGLPVAIGVLGVASYWVGQVAFGWAGIVVALLVVLAGSAFALARGYAPERGPAVEAFVVFVVGFLFVVAIRAADAAADPYAGEKMLDFGLLATLYRAPALPPEDMWFAGERLQYYYGGHMIAAQLGRLTRTAPAYAYNLALAAYYGLTVAAAYGLARSLALARGISPRRAGALGAVLVGVASNLSTPARGLILLVQHLQRPITFQGPVDVLLAPLRVLFLVVPNDTVRVVSPEDGGRFVEVLGYQFSGLAVSADGFGYWAASRVIPWTINEFPLFAYLNGDLHAHMMSPPLLLVAVAFAFAYWRAPPEAVWRRRASLLVAAPALGGLLAVVNTWSFPSVAGIVALTTAFAAAHPVTVLPAPVADRVRAIADASRLHEEVTRGAVAVVLAGVVGALSVAFALPFFSGATSGQYPALLPDRSSLVGLVLVHGAFLLVTVAYFLDRSRVDRDALETGLLTGVIAVIAVGALAVGWLPESLFVPWLPADLLVVAAAGVLAAAALSNSLRDRALVAGGVLALVAFAAYHGSQVAFVGAGGAALFAVAAAAFADESPARRAAVGVAVAVAVLGGVAWVLDATVLVVVAPVLFAGMVLLRLRRDVGFEAVLVLGATGLVTLVEFLYVAERAGPGRLNTVFKLYWQVWVMWGVAGGVMLADVASRAWPRWLVRPALARAPTASGRTTSADGGTDASTDGGRDDSGGVDWGRVLRVGSTVGAVVLVLSLSLYGGFAVVGHFQANPSAHWVCGATGEDGAGEWTLDAKDWSEECYPDQAAAITWLNDRDGRPVVVEAPTVGQYLYGANSPASGLVSGVSSHTGLPTVAGWAHAANYHTQAEWDARIAHVETIYESADANERAAVLREYGVSYVYVGPNERSRYDVANLDADPGVERVQRWGDVVVYAVDQDTLAGNANETTAVRDVDDVTGTSDAAGVNGRVSSMASAAVAVGGPWATAARATSGSHTRDSVTVALLGEMEKRGDRRVRR
jgi:YYY domain-containing protein